MWLNPLRRTWAEAEQLFQAVRLIHAPDEIDRVLSEHLSAAPRTPHLGRTATVLPG